MIDRFFMRMDVALSSTNESACSEYHGQTFLSRKIRQPDSVCIKVMHSRFSSPSPATRMRTGRPIFQTLFIPSNTRSRQQEPLQYLRRMENFPALHEFIGSMGLGDVVRTEGN